MIEVINLELRLNKKWKSVGEETNAGKLKKIFFLCNLKDNCLQ